MKRKIIICLLCFLTIIPLSGCGEQKQETKKEEKVKINKEYQEYIDAIRDGQASAYMGNYTVGELFDNALVSSRWDQYTKALAGGTKKILISVKGENKFEEDQTIEVVYEVNKETLDYSFYEMLVNNEKGGNLMSLMKKSADDLDSQKEK